jgi:formate dehydrogenase assembly factor FdhD
MITKAALAGIPLIATKAMPSILEMRLQRKQIYAL